MEQDLLHYLLASFPRNPGSPSPEAGDDDYLLLHGYRVPFESPVDGIMLGILAEFRRSGFVSDALVGSDRG